MRCNSATCPASDARPAGVSHVRCPERTTEADGAFTYTFFKGVGIVP